MTEQGTPPIDSIPDPRRQKRERALRIVLSLVVVLMPFAAIYTLTLFQGYDLFNAVPVWSDERWWYALYAGMSKYGRPLGYFGFSGTHAPVGTYACWGLYAALPTGLLARVFGWGLHSFVYYNIFFLTAAMAIFVLLTKPSIRSLCMMAVSNALLFVALEYTMICMNEVVRYSMAIVLTGIMYRLLTVPEVSRRRQVLRWTLIPLLLAFATCFDMVLGLFIPVYLFLILRRWKPWKRILAAAPITAAAMAILFKVKDVTCAPYLPGQSVLDLPAPTLKIRIMNFFYTYLKKLQEIDPLYLLTRGSFSNDNLTLFWVVLLVYVAVGILLWRLLSVRRRQQAGPAHPVQLLCLYLLVGCWGGLVLLYDSEAWTFVRHCYVAVCCVMLLSALLPRGEGHTWWAMTAVCLLSSVAFLSVFPSTFAKSSRFPSQAKQQLWDERRQTLEDVIVLDEDAADPWVNTVVLRHATLGDVYSLPYGVGLNTGTKEPKYLVLGYDYEDTSARDGDLQSYLDQGRELIYEDEYVSVLAKTS